MYYCPHCGYEFEKSQAIYESHGLSSPPFEKYSVCPNCKSTDFYEKITTHCRCCGAKLKAECEEYCSQSCRVKGEKLWQKELKRRRLIETDPISETVRELMQYNMLHKTDYSYGQYVTLIKNNKGNKKCAKKRKNT